MLHRIKVGTLVFHFIRVEASLICKMSSRTVRTVKQRNCVSENKYKKYSFYFSCHRIFIVLGLA